MNCFRRLKNKNASQNDDDIVSPVRSQDLFYKQKIPRILLHRLSSSEISQYHNKSVSNDEPIDSCESITALYDTSEHLEQILQTPPPEPNFCTSTPMSTRVLNSDDAPAPARSIGMKRSSSERGVSPDISHKISQSNMSRSRCWSRRKFHVKSVCTKLPTS